MSLTESLSACGLNTSEQAVLKCLLRLGSRTAGMVAKATGIKRPTIYPVLENLVRDGLVMKKAGEGTTVYSCIPLQEIPKLFQKKAELEYEQMQKAVENLSEELDELQSEIPQSYVDYSVVTYDSTEAAFMQLFDAALGGDFCAIFNPQLAVNPKSKAAVAKYLKTTAQKKPKIREVAVAGPMTDWYKERIKNPNHSFRTIPSTSGILSNIIIRERFVVIAHYTEKGMMSIKVDHPDFYSTMMCTFEIVWKQAELKQ